MRVGVSARARARATVRTRVEAEGRLKKSEVVMEAAGRGGGGEGLRACWGYLGENQAAHENARTSSPHEREREIPKRIGVHVEVEHHHEQPATREHGGDQQRRPGTKPVHQFAICIVWKRVARE